MTFNCEGRQGPTGIYSDGVFAVLWLSWFMLPCRSHSINRKLTCILNRLQEEDHGFDQVIWWNIYRALHLGYCPDCLHVLVGNRIVFKVFTLPKITAVGVV